jgi:hypothetical protein
MPPVPVRGIFVVVLVVVVALMILPFGVALLFDHSEGMTIEPLTRWAIVIAVFIAPVVGFVAALRRGLVPRAAFLVAAGIMSLACFALLVGVTSTEGVVQIQVASAIAAIAITVASRIRPNAPRDVPARPDVLQTSSRGPRG